MRSLILFALMFLCLQVAAQKNTEASDHYLIKLYHCSTLPQIEHVENYVGNMLKPFLKKYGVETLGVFIPISNDTALDKRLMVWLPLKSLDALTNIESAFGAIDPFGENAVVHLDSFSNNSPYTRIETSLATAFKMHPHYSTAKSFKRSVENIYEFRSYESSTEDLHLRKVHMFNEGGEIDLFRRLDFNAVFYARVIVGPRMPNLVYMTSFSDMASRNAHWKSFSEDPQWKALSPMPKYAGTVSRNETILMRASRYSDL
jgi:hypothetical protein